MNTTFQFNCKNCGKLCIRKNCYNPKYRPDRSGNKFCDKKCLGAFKNKTITLPCSWCHNPVERSQAELKKSKSGNTFCCKSCSASYNNTQKRKSRRSKAETKLYEMIKSEFPNLEILPNDKTMLNGLEIDIAIPSKNLGIEWNGIVHFEPIYGQTKLNKIQQNDVKKKELAKNKGINLIVVPDLVSTNAYIKEAFLKIKQIILNL